MYYFYLRAQGKKKKSVVGFANQTSWDKLDLQCPSKKCQFSVKESLLPPIDSPYITLSHLLEF